MPASVRVSNTGKNTGNTSLPLTPPPGIQPGDLWVVGVLAANAAGYTTDNIPKRWWKVDGLDVNTRQYSVLARIWNPTDPESEYTLTLSVGAPAKWIGLGIMDHAVTQQSDIVLGTKWRRGDNGGSQGPITAPSITTALNNMFVLVFTGEASNALGGYTVTAQNGFTKIAEITEGAVASTDIDWVTAWSKIQTPAGATGAFTLTYGATISLNGIAQQLGIPSAATVVPTTGRIGARVPTSVTHNSITMGVDRVGGTAIEIAAKLGATEVARQTVTVDSTSGWGSTTFTGLQPDSQYGFEFYVDGALQTDTEALIRTHPTPGTPTSFKFIAGSCQFTGSNHPVWDRILDEGARGLAHMGDLNYADTTDPAVWRTAVESSLTAPRFRSMLGLLPMTWTWDNHDRIIVDDGGAGNGLNFGRTDPATLTGWRQLAGTSGWASSDTGGRTWVIGRVRFIQTDNWTMKTDPDAGTVPTNQQTFLGAAQKQWFKDTLDAATEPLIVWFCQWTTAETGSGRWNSYNTETQELEAFINARPSVKSRMVMIGGDSHSVQVTDGSRTTGNFDGIPSYNISGFNRSSDSGHGGGGWLFDAPLRTSAQPEADWGGYSRLSVTDDGEEISLFWEGVRVNAAGVTDVMASQTITKKTVQSLASIASTNQPAVVDISAVPDGAWMIATLIQSGSYQTAPAPAGWENLLPTNSQQSGTRAQAYAGRIKQAGDTSVSWGPEFSAQTGSRRLVVLWGVEGAPVSEWERGLVGVRSAGNVVSGQSVQAGSSTTSVAPATAVSVADSTVVSILSEATTSAGTFSITSGATQIYSSGDADIIEFIVAGVSTAAVGTTPAVTATGAQTQAANGQGLQIVVPPRGPAPEPYRGFANIAEMLMTPGFTWAHRGLTTFAEESRYAYDQAVALGHGALEFSMGRTSDGVWFGTHDNTLNRVTGSTGLPPVIQMTWAQVQALNINIGQGAPKPFMRWEELRDAYGQSHVLILDPKNYNWGTYQSEFLDMCDQLGPERVIVKQYASDMSLSAAAQARGYITWGHTFDDFMADPNLTTYLAGWSLLGIDYSASQSDWNVLLATGKPVIGHIADNQAAYDTSMSKGALGVQSTSASIQPVSWWNAAREIDVVVSGEGTLGAVSEAIVLTDASFTGAGSLQATTDFSVVTGAVLSGSGSLTAATEVVVEVQAAFTGSGSLTGALSVEQSIEAPFTGSGDLDADVGTEQSADVLAHLTGLGSLTAVVGAELSADATASFAGSGSLSATVSAELIVEVEAVFSGSGTLDAPSSGELSAVVEAVFGGSGQLLADVSTEQSADVLALFSGLGTLTADVSFEQIAVAEFSGLGSLTVSVQTEDVAVVDALFTGSGLLTMEAEIVVAVPAPFTSAGTLAAASEIIYDVSAEYTGGGTLVAVAWAYADDENLYLGDRPVTLSLGGRTVKISK